MDTFVFRTLSTPGQGREDKTTQIDETCTTARKSIAPENGSVAREVDSRRALSEKKKGIARVRLEQIHIESELETLL